jgi:hypothetical protein
MTTLLLASLLFASDPAAPPDAAVEPPTPHRGYFLRRDSDGRIWFHGEGEAEPDKQYYCRPAVRWGMSVRELEDAESCPRRVWAVGVMYDHSFAVTKILWEDGP